MWASSETEEPEAAPYWHKRGEAGGFPYQPAWADSEVDVL